MLKELEDFNPFVIDSPEYMDFELAKVAQNDIDVLTRNGADTDPIGQSLIRNRETDRNLLLDGIDGK